MDLDWIWKAILIVVAGTLLLRIAGRKSISQMTLAQTVIMIGIGSLLIQPVAGKNIWTTIGVGLILVLTLMVMEYLQVKSDRVEQFITGKSKILMENGNINEKNFKKLRMTVDQLEMKLRQQGVSKLSDVKWATLEPNGQVGVELMPQAKPVTKKDFEQFQAEVQRLINMLNVPPTTKRPVSQEVGGEDIFKEIKQKSSANPPPKHLQ
ncbi:MULTISPECIES: DUF421 domain-containing protein [Rossellomorea]|uniref:DUF421 domain-containing protein n=1 Tax=Rossellomorea TaxID=2837508 RepID=UPI0011E97401|nr:MULTISPECIES: DUF421 domain-containing protein [Rossellomorea]MDT9025547.1 DUF421 domain-containing protein [Rossellomorea sp. YC4-1]TYS89853.1 DUF421 domain-containing protein [Rossellomorea aquimaris]